MKALFSCKSDLDLIRRVMRLHMRGFVFALKDSGMGGNGGTGESALGVRGRVFLADLEGLLVTDMIRVASSS